MDQEQQEDRSGTKRKRVDDGTPARSTQKAYLAEPEWDKVTFRVSRIPEIFDQKIFTHVIAQIFDLDPNDFKIHSLVSDASDEADLPHKTATISFRMTPEILETPQGFADGRDFELPQDLGAESGRSRIHFDTHFEGFTPLSPADQATEPTIDCIVIPGWGGHALGSFRSHTSSYVWLRDSLSKHCPELRVWTYGYHSHLADTNASADVYEFAERFRRKLRVLRQQTKAVEKARPLIFIVHSLGGWIFKDAYTQMRKSPNDVDRWNCLSTYGALFFGVPTHGMNVEAIRKMVQDLPGRYISALLDQQDGFRLRQRQHQAFCEAFNYEDSRIVQFFELKKSSTVTQDPETKEWSRKGSPALLVSPASASYGRGWETDGEHNISLDGDHSDMVKFSDCIHNDYAIVRGVLREFIAQAASAVKSRVEKSLAAQQSSESRQSTPEKQACLQSLHFPEMSWRRNDIADPANATCRWISKHPNYLRWSNQQQGLLWIKGRPGVGKSTVLKHALDVAELAGGRGTTLASFFFHGRGTLIQKSVIGLFRSLLHQLLQKLPELLAEFSALYKERMDAEGQFGVKWNWREKELQNFFKSSVVKAARTHKICLYIDALDECGEDTAIDLVNFFQRFESPLAICFSCRHYPIIALDSGLEISVEDWNNNDIITYIRTTIGAHITRTDIATPVCDEIAAKSLGNFQWVVLIVPRVVRLYKKGNSLAILKTKIKQIPSELSDLYKELLGSIDEEDLSQSLTLIRWIVFAARPLTLDELRFALVVDTASSFTSIRECQSSEFFSNSDEELKRRVLSLSQGLVEVGTERDFNFKERVVVQFIHQSVKDYLLEGGLRFLDKCSSDNVIGRGHLCLSRSCFKFLDMEETQQAPSARRATPFNYSADEMMYLRFCLMGFPYHHHWLFHSEEVEKQNLSPEDLLSTPWKPSGRVVERWIQGYQTGHPPSTLLHLASYHNLVSVVNTILERGIEVDLRDGVGRTPLSYAAQKGNQAVIMRFLDQREVNLNSQDNYGCSPLSYAIISKNETITKLLLDRREVKPNSQDNCGRSPLSYAIISKNETITKLLLDREDIDADLKDFNEWTPLSYAAKCGHEKMVRILLERNDVDANGKNSRGRTPLYFAIAGNYETIGKVLLEQEGVDLRQRDKLSGRTILHLACEHGMEAIVKLLLQRNIEIDTRDIRGYTPLSIASQEGWADIVRLLLSRGAKLNSRGEQGDTPILMAMGSVLLPGSRILNSRKEVVQILLQRVGVEVVLEDIEALRMNTWETAKTFEMRKQLLREELLQH